MTTVITASVFAGCGKNNSGSKTEEDSAVVTEETANVYEVVSTRAYDYDFTNVTAREFTQYLAMGWNLGNTFDATGGKYDDPYSQETSWGNPEVTQELIKAVADYGFTTIRIPVTWGNYCDDNYVINEAYIDRVQEVVDWALEEGLFVILNTHHESWLVPTKEKYEEVSEQLCTMWKQIAEHFSDYDERLIFEGMNEPRVGNDWNGNSTTQEVVNNLGLDFVATIRGCSGYNTTRFLMVPCYAATSNSNVWKKYKWPDDDRVIMSIHAYMPYDFALNTNGTDQWSRENKGDTADIDRLFSSINDIILKSGHACVIGEMGCMGKGPNIDSRIDNASYFAEKASFYRVPFCWWDNNSFTSGETFGLIRRTFNNSLYTGIIEGMLNAWYYTEFKFDTK